ncbi:MAG: ASPIC/UnbV domain-containing protein, partial [Phycisphaerales bacterium]
PLGCRIEVDAGDTTHRRWILGGTGYLSALPLEAHVGLGNHRGPVTVRTYWPDGQMDEQSFEAADRVVKIERPAGD